MSQKIAIIIVVIFLFLMILVMIEPFINKGKEEQGEKRYKYKIVKSIKNVAMYIVVPTIIGIITAFLGTIYFSQDNNNWSNHISTNDEQILEENGICDLNGYYVRVNETDNKLDTNTWSPFFKRIDTEDTVKSKTYKYRYLEIVNKNRNTAYSEVHCLEDNSNYILSTNNTLGNYIDELIFYDKKDNSIVRYYLYGELYENYTIPTSYEEFYENIYMKDSIQYKNGNELDLLIFKFGSKIELNAGKTDNGYRESIGYINNKENRTQQDYYYEQIVELGNDSSIHEIVVLSEKYDPQIFNDDNDTYEEIVFKDYNAVSNSNVEYQYLGSTLIFEEGQGVTTMYMYLKSSKEK